MERISKCLVSCYRIKSIKMAVFYKKFSFIHVAIRKINLNSLNRNLEASDNLLLLIHQRILNRHKYSREFLLHRETNLIFGISVVCKGTFAEGEMLTGSTKIRWKWVGNVETL